MCIRDSAGRLRRGARGHRRAGHARPGGEPRVPVHVVQIVDVVLEVDETLSGVVDSEAVTIEWLAWSEGGEMGQVRRAIVLNGLETPEIGAEMVWFVSREDGSVGGVPRYGLVSLDGIFTVVDDKIVYEGEPDLGTRSTGLTIEELAAEIGK